MPNEPLKGLVIEELLASPAGQKIQQVMDVIASVQKHVFALKDSEDGARLKLLRIGTIFQIFLIDTLARGKKASELTPEDWKKLAEKVSQYAILSDGQGYSEFVFTLYADYIDLSVRCLRERIPNDAEREMEESLASIQKLADTMRQHKDSLRDGTMTEAAYVEECLWLSLEAMIKLLAVSLALVAGTEFTMLAQAVAQLAFEYGRFVLYAKEHALLESYLQNQRVLDNDLQREYDAFLSNIKENSDRFQSLLDAAFTPLLHESLLQSAALARAAGVPEKELLTSAEDIDDYFLV